MKLGIPAAVVAARVRLRRRIRRRAEVAKRVSLIAEDGPKSTVIEMIVGRGHKLSRKVGSY